MPPLRKCRMKQLLEKITTADETDHYLPSSIKVIKNVLHDLKQMDGEASDGELIKHVDETFMDANIYHTASHVAYKCIQNVNYTQHKFNSDEFIDKLINFTSEGQPEEYSVENLDILGEHVNLNKFMPALGNYASIYGGLINQPEPPPKVRKERMVVNAEKPAKKQLTKVVERENVGDKKSEDILKYYFKVLTEEFRNNGNQSVDYYKFVIDTSDFGITVENMFYTSFILNDGMIKLVLEDNNPKLIPFGKKALLAASQSGPLVKYQLVTSVSFEMWQTQCEMGQEGIVQRYRREHGFI